MGLNYYLQEVEVEKPKKERIKVVYPDIFVSMLRTIIKNDAFSTCSEKFQNAVKKELEKILLEEQKADSECI